MKVEFDKDVVRDRFLTACSTLYGRENNKLYKTKKAFCDAAGFKTAQMNNLEQKRANVSTMMLFGLHIASQGSVDIREVLSGRQYRDAQNNIVSPGQKVVDLRSIQQAKALIEMLHGNLTDMERQ